MIVVINFIATCESNVHFMKLCVILCFLLYLCLCVGMCACVYIYLYYFDI